MDSRFSRLYYARYADDFIVGLIGNKETAIEISENIQKFLSEELSLQPNQDKTQVLHSSQTIRFLGTDIHWLEAKRIKRTDDEIGFPLYRRIAYNRANLRVPMAELCKRAVDRGFATYRQGKGIRATSCSKLVNLETIDIVKRYSAIIRGILGYYSFVQSRSDLWGLISAYRKSCALTIGRKLKIRSASQVFSKFGPYLRVSDNLGKNTVTIE